MLTYIRGAHTVTVAIETLGLIESFDLVVLGSHLINTQDARLRAAFLDCCRRHVRNGGCVTCVRGAALQPAAVSGPPCNGLLRCSFRRRPSAPRR